MVLARAPQSFRDASYGALVSNAYQRACQEPVQLLKALPLSPMNFLHVEIRAGLVFLTQFGEGELLNASICVNMEEYEILDCHLQKSADQLRLCVDFLSEAGVLSLAWDRSSVQQAFFDDFLVDALSQFGDGDHIVAGAFHLQWIMDVRPKMIAQRSFPSLPAHILCGAFLAGGNCAVGLANGFVALVDTSFTTSVLINTSDPLPPTGFFAKFLSAEVPVSISGGVVCLAVLKDTIFCVNAAGKLQAWSIHGSKLWEHILVNGEDKLQECVIKVSAAGDGAAVGLTMTVGVHEIHSVVTKSTVLYARLGARRAEVEEFAFHADHARELLSRYAPACAQALSSFDATVIEILPLTRKSGVQVLWAVWLHVVQPGSSQSLRVFNVVTHHALGQQQQQATLVSKGSCLDLYAQDLKQLGMLDGSDPLPQLRKELWRIITHEPLFTVPVLVAGWNAAFGEVVSLSSRLLHLPQVAHHLVALLDRNVRDVVQKHAILGSMEEEGSDIEQSVWRNLACQFLSKCQDFAHQQWTAASNVVLSEECVTWVTCQASIGLATDSFGEDLEQIALGELREALSAQFPGALHACIEEMLCALNDDSVTDYTQQGVSYVTALARIVSSHSAIAEKLRTCWGVWRGVVNLALHPRPPLTRLPCFLATALLVNQLRDWQLDLLAASVLISSLDEFGGTSWSKKREERDFLNKVVHSLMTSATLLNLSAQFVSRSESLSPSRTVLQQFLDSLPGCPRVEELQSTLDDPLSAFLIANKLSSAAKMWTRAGVALLAGLTDIQSSTAARHRSRLQALPQPTPFPFSPVPIPSNETALLLSAVKEAVEVEVSTSETLGQSVATVLVLGRPTSEMPGAAQGGIPAVGQILQSLGSLSRCSGRFDAVPLTRLLETVHVRGTQTLLRSRMSASSDGALDRALLSLMLFLRSQVSGTGTALSVSYQLAQSALEGPRPSAMLALRALLCCDTQSEGGSLLSDLLDDVLVKIATRGSLNDLVFISSTLRSGRRSLIEDVRRALLLAGKSNEGLESVAAMRVLRGQWTRAAEILQKIGSSSAQTSDLRRQCHQSAELRALLKRVPAMDRLLAQRLQPVPVDEDLSFVVANATLYAVDRAAGNSGSLHQELLAKGLWSLWLGALNRDRPTGHQSAASELLRKYLPARPSSRSAFMSPVRGVYPSREVASSAALCHTLWQLFVEGDHSIFLVLEALLIAHRDDLHTAELLSQLLDRADASVPAAKRLLQVLVRCNALTEAAAFSERLLRRPNAFEFLCTSMDVLALRMPGFRAKLPRLLEAATLNVA